MKSLLKIGFLGYLQCLFLVLAGCPLLVISASGQAEESHNMPKNLAIGARFSRDSVKIAEPIIYKMVLKHPVGSQAIFPDSGFDYSPFELLEKKYYPTISDSSISTDSVSYTLQTFNLSDTLPLSLPVYFIINGDSVPVYPKPDTVWLQREIRTPRPDAPLKAATNFGKVERRFNYPYVMLGGGVLAIILIFLNRFLGKPVERFIRLILLFRRQKAFLVSFDRMAGQALREQSAKRTEQTLNVWKKHIERIDGRPFSTFTTKEMVQAIPEENLKNTLQQIDRCVYAGQTELIVKQVFNELRRQSELFYQRKRAEIRNG